MKKDQKTMELLLSAVNDGTINLIDVAKRQEMNKRKEILDSHCYRIWPTEDGKWKTYLPDPDKGRVIRERRTREDLEDLIVEYYREQQAKTDTDKRDEEFYAFRNMYKAYKDYKASLKLSANTIYKYEKDYERFLAGTEFAEYDIREIDEEMIESFIIGKIEELNLKPEAGKELWGLIAGTFKRARRKHYIRENPCEYVDVKLFSSHYNNERKDDDEIIFNDADRRALDDQIEKDILKQPEYIPNYAAKLAECTGMRPGELAALSWGDVDTKKGVLKIQRSEKLNKMTRERFIDETKTHRVRQFPLVPEIKHILGMVKKIELEYGWIGEFVFQDQNGRVNKEKISSCIARRCRQAGIPVRYATAVRKTLNSNLKREGAPSSVTSALLGNSERVNNKHYTYDTSGMDEKHDIVERTLRKQRTS